MDPAIRSKILTTLRNDFDDYTPRLKSVAKYIVDNPADFGLDPIRITAKKVGVSTYTMVRMAEVLGFISFDELREPFRTALVSTVEPASEAKWIDELEQGDAFSRQLASTSRNTQAITSRSLRMIDAAQLERIVNILFKADNVYITAVRAAYGLAYYFNYVGRMAIPSLHLIPRNMNSPIDEMAMAGPDDVLIAITFAPYSKETVEACRFAVSRGVKLVLITDSDVVVPEFKPTETLVATTSTTHYFGCYTGAMAVVESLVAMLVRSGGDEALERIKAYDIIRDEYDAFWKAPKKT